MGLQGCVSSSFLHRGYGENGETMRPAGNMHLVGYFLDDSFEEAYEMLITRTISHDFRRVHPILHRAD